MKTDNNRQYMADEGKVFSRKSDGFIMGSGLDLGESDTIENYEEIDVPEGYKEDLKEIKHENNHEIQAQQ